MDRSVEAVFRAFDALGEEDHAITVRDMHFRMSAEEAIRANLTTKKEKGQYQKELEQRRAEQRAQTEESRRQAEAELKRKEEERQQQRAAAAEAAAYERRAQEEKVAAAEAERHRKFQSLLQRHQAADLSEMTKAFAFLKNPYAYQGKKVLLYGAYEQHIGPGRAIINLVSPALANPNFVQWDTERNLAELSVKGKPFVHCVVKVVGTTVVTRGIVDLTIPHVKEVECTP